MAIYPQEAENPFKGRMSWKTVRPSPLATVCHEASPSTPHPHPPACPPACPPPRRIHILLHVLHDAFIRQHQGRYQWDAYPRQPHSATLLSYMQQMYI